ncbi:MAG: DNA-binding protein (Fragment) [uncultured Thiotrichaceae bacterium]|uniref:DNA-binding protein n=1 Tax=uncultured Thiotrichaceae bacterium TaxID=298394 RepID=A0A6S6TE55_9GAMM
MEATIDSDSVTSNDRHDRNVAGSEVLQPKSVEQSAEANVTPKRGRPKGARTTTLAEARRQAAEEKVKLKRDFNKINDALQRELTILQEKYDRDIARLNDELEICHRREANYRLALGERLHEVADYLQTTLLNWGDAELKEAVIDKRGRGRPRKTLK